MVVLWFREITVQGIGLAAIEADTLDEVLTALPAYGVTLSDVACVSFR